MFTNATKYIKPTLIIIFFSTPSSRYIQINQKRKYVLLKTIFLLNFLYNHYEYIVSASY